MVQQYLIISFIKHFIYRDTKLECFYFGMSYTFRDCVCENPGFCLVLYLTGVHFRVELQHAGHVVGKKSSVDQSELEKWVVSDCQWNYMFIME